VAQLAETYNDHLTAIRQVRQIDLPVQTVPSRASLDDSIDIFDRVNSQGTKLTDAELALTHITGKWSHARRIFKAKIEDLEAKNFEFNLNFMTRSLTGVVVKRVLFETIHEVPKDQLVPGWSRRIGSGRSQIFWAFTLISPMT
jgi:hypothetical protein